MKATNLNKQTNEVLFQKLGATWYAFTEIKGDIIYSALPSGMDPYTTKTEFFEVIENHLEKVSKRSVSRSRDMAA